ncbi:MAG: hypothetical protein JXB17_08005 [Bacteroidales bacterium]|nr:hypothetical protein [Bacteroidales bacterium]
MKIKKYSIGIGDRFGHQGKAQLQAFISAQQAGFDITPVWNKSNREHSIIHTSPVDTRIAADDAVKKMKWNNPYFVDADHINMSNVDKFIESSDFFTIDVADYIGKSDPASSQEHKNIFIDQKITINGIEKPIIFNEKELSDITNMYSYAVSEAAKIYRNIESKKEKDNFITEVSMDEVNNPQTSKELLVILALLGEEKIPAQTIAPRFIGRFNKGVDYVGEINEFEKQFEEFILIIDYAIKHFGLPENLKLSVHSGSDKFSIYPVINKIIKKHGKGIHLKTAGTTWLEEVIGLALAGGEALELAKLIYIEALHRMDELCKPYEHVIDIDIKKLPSASDVNKWDSKKYVNTLRHIPNCTDFNPNFRQLIHVGYKIATEHSDMYYKYLRQHADIIGTQVMENILERHIKRIFDF